MTKTLIYLATPYTHPDPVVVEWRFKTVNRVAARLMGEGLHIFSPISHTHPIATDAENPLPTGWEFWRDYDFAILSCCRALYVLTLDGWQQSTGVTAEIKMAKELGIPVTFINS